MACTEQVMSYTADPPTHARISDLPNCWFTMQPAALLAAYDLLMLELRERLAGVRPGELGGVLIDLGDELVEGHGWRGSDARRVIAAMQFDLREAARYWLGLSQAVIEWEHFDTDAIERSLLEHLCDPRDVAWQALASFAVARQQLGRTFD
jgi:hypothetical protein